MVMLNCGFFSLNVLLFQKLILFYQVLSRFV